MNFRYTVFITPTANADLESAVEYYNNLSDGLGIRFADLVGDYINRIIAVPTASAIRYKNVRCKPMDTFPYLIMYTLNEGEHSIAILRFFHTSQEPLW